MTFDKLHEGIKCNCIKDANIDNTNLFARRVNLKSPFKNADFKFSTVAKSETDDCIEWCSIRGISTHLYNEESKMEVINKNLLTMQIVQGSKKQLSIFKIKNDGGMVKNTPNQKGGIDKYHYDLYKPDDFDCEKHLELKELITIEQLEKMMDV